MPNIGPVSVTRGSVLSAQRKRSTSAVIPHPACAGTLTAAAASAAARIAFMPLHPLDHRLAEAGARHLLRALHLAREVVGHDLVADGFFHRPDDGVGGFH